MSTLITGNDLHKLIDAGVIDARHEHVNGSSIDVRLGSQILYEAKGNSSAVNLADKELPRMHSLNLDEQRNRAATIYPGQFVLAHTVEIFNLPDYVSTEFKLRSSVARAGLNHSLAGWCDPGWHGSHLTLELKNILEHQPLIITAGMRIGQMVFYRHACVDTSHSYANRGRYNGRIGVSREAV